MNWWRIELDTSGAITAHQKVEAAHVSTRSVRYVQAATAADACVSVKSWYEKYRDSSRKRSKQQRLKALKEGMCTKCRKRPPRIGKQRCQICTEVAAENYKAVKAGKVTPRLSPVEVEAKIKFSNHAMGARLTIVLNRFDALGPAAFRQWLVTEIELRKQKVLDIVASSGHNDIRF